MSAISRNARPDLALRFMPVDARAQAKAAEQRLTARTRADDRRRGGERLARRSAAARSDRGCRLAHLGPRRGPARADGEGRVAVPPFRTAVAARFADPALADRGQGRQNDIAGALRHYDAALRTTPNSGEQLLPILVSASAEPAVAAALVPLLAGNPPWRRNFLVALYENVPPGDRVVPLLEGLYRDRPVTETDAVGGVVAQLIDRREFGAAWRVYRLLPGRAAPGSALLRNSGFEGTAPLAPFDWHLEARSELEAQQRPINSGGAHPALVIHADTGHSGQVARQLLLLPAGTYSLVARAGTIESLAPASLGWQIVCLDGQATRLADFDIPPLTASARGHRVDFRVPSGCPAQWLLLTAEADGDTPGGADGWVDSAAIRPAAARR